MPTSSRVIGTLIMMAVGAFVPQTAHGQGSLPEAPPGAVEPPLPAAPPAPAPAAPPAPVGPPAPAELDSAAQVLLAPPRPERHDHLGQLGLSVMPGVGYRVIARYKEEQTCLDRSGDDSKWVCTSAVPFFLDLQLSYGLTRRIDLIGDLRLGIGRQGDAPGVGRQLAVAPGLRIWLDNDVRLKFFTTLQGLYDGTRQGQAAVDDGDWGLRNANGLMYDAIRNVGFYVQFGETVSVVRWFRIELDAGLGVQVRFP